jgi:threonine aldolase
MRGFASDNNAGAHPEVLKELEKVNTDHSVGYGDDEYTRKAIDLLKKQFGAETDPYIVLTGTGANTLIIQTLLHSFQAVVCANTAHINVDECGAPELLTGSKLISIETNNGKIKPDDIEPLLHTVGFEHHVQPKLISITQPTELGTLYSIDEIKSLSAFAKKNDMYLHIDGARLANAAVALGESFKAITFDAGADVVSFGGTKNGLIMGEAVIFKDQSLGENFKYIRKQGMQLFSKMRYLSAQFIAYLNGDLWQSNALHANSMANKLREKIEEIDAISLTQNVESNALFATIPEQLIEPLQQEYFFYVWNPEINEVRWMTSWDTTMEDINGFVEKIKSLL